MWSTSLNVPVRERSRLNVDAAIFTGSRCVTIIRASGYVANTESSSSPYCGDFSCHRPGHSDCSTWSTSRWYRVASSQSDASNHSS